MRVSSRIYISLYLTAALIGLSESGFAIPNPLWTGAVSSDLNTAANWTPMAPGPSDEADFDSTSAINFNPTATSNFSVANLNFLQSAQAFQFTLNNCGIIFSGSGITGNQTNTTVLINNIDNAASLPYLIQLTNGAGASFGSASITLVNQGDASGAVSGVNSSVIGNNQIANAFSMSLSDGALLAAGNSGTDSSTGTGGNDVGTVGSTLVELSSTVTLGNNVTVLLDNVGTYTGSNSASSNNVGVIGNPLLSTGAFQAGDNFSLIANNQGTDSSSGVGGNHVGFVDDPMVEFNSLTVGNHATFIIVNQGNNSSAAPGSSTGYVDSEQFAVYGTFTAGQNLSMIVVNNATNTGPSTNVGVVQGSQVSISGDCFLNDGTTFVVVNEGSGSVMASQVNFQQGFTVNGKATMVVINNAPGHIMGHGIIVDDGVNSLGGDVTIALSRNDLFVNTNNPTFTVAGLEGDDKTSVQSKPLLVINTDTGANPNFGGAIQNFGMSVSALMINGSGSQTLSGVNTFTGLTTVQGGNLILTGSLAGDVLVNPLGTLSGTGTAQNVTVAGTVSPGQSIGIINFATYTNNGGTYFAEVNGAGASDLINVTGTATINGGTVEVASVDGTYSFQDRYTIVQAAAVNGTYANAVGVSPAIRPTLSYDAQHVYLMLSTQFGSVANTHNERNVATQLDNIVNPDPAELSLINALANLNTSQQIQSALDSLSGWQYTTDLYVSQVVNQQFVKRLYDAVRFIVITDPEECCRDDWDIWVEGGATYTQLGGNSNAHGLNMNGGEVTAGVQKTYCCNWTFGLSGSYEHDNINYKKQGGTGRADSYFGGLYGLYNSSSFYTLADLTYGYTATRLHRKMHVGSTQFHANGNPKISQFTFYGEAGGDWNVRNFLIQPFLGLVAGGNWADDLKEESSSGLQMNIKSKDVGIFDSRLGFHITTQPSGGYISLDIAWDKRLTGNHANIGGQFAEFGGDFTIDGVRLNSNSIDYAVTIAKWINDCKLYVQGSGETWNKANRFEVLAGLEYSW